MNKRKSALIIIDILLIIGVFILFIYLKKAPLIPTILRYLKSFILFLAIWVSVSWFSDKYKKHPREKLNRFIFQLILINILALGIITTLMFLFRIAYFSRFLVFGTIIATTLVELFAWTLYHWIIHASTIFDSNSLQQYNERNKKKKLPEVKKHAVSPSEEFEGRQEAVLIEIDNESFDFIFSYARIESPKTLIISTTSQFNLKAQLEKNFESIVNLKRINDMRFVNKFFEAANSKLIEGGLFIDFVETKNQRKERILSKFPPILNLIYYFFDFILKRIFPKFLLTKYIYFALTRGQNRVLTKAETFGRLYSCGFEVIAEKHSKGFLYFIARKIQEPFFPEEPSYGPFVKLKRVGKSGKLIKVYKLRTMHPYSEFLQNYIYDKEGLKEGGKFKSDFRISSIGKLLRMFWLDELPMLINWLKGDLKLVGVRPLSEHYFSLYPKDHQERRIKYKPGLVPPFYADNPKTLEEIIDSEKKYFDKYDKHPLLTDFSYFFRAFFNIIFKKYRSA